jgi:hypothetical protein
MRYFTFRFLQSRWQIIREITIASTEERDAQVAAWHVLREDELRKSLTGTFARAEWRLLSVVIRPVTDLADALS